MAKQQPTPKRVREVLEYEALNFASELRLLDHAELAGGVLVVVYQFDGEERDGLGIPRQTRLVAYSGERQMFSSIVGTEWIDG